MTDGTVYPILARLTREGVLVAEWVADEAPHPRKYYKLTDKGRKTLTEMLAHWSDFTRKIERLAKAARKE